MKSESHHYEPNAKILNISSDQFNAIKAWLTYTVESPVDVANQFERAFKPVAEIPEDDRPERERMDGFAVHGRTLPQGDDVIAAYHMDRRVPEAAIKKWAEAKGLILSEENIKEIAEQLSQPKLKNLSRTV